MSKNTNVIVLVLLTSLLGTTAAWASDVYIDQAGSTTTIDIVQTGAGNTVGSSGTASTIIGDNTVIDIKQVGANNTADIETATGASGTSITYEATGGTNTLDAVSDQNIVNLSQSGSGVPVVTLNVDGDSNAVNITQN